MRDVVKKQRKLDADAPEGMPAEPEAAPAETPQTIDWSQIEALIKELEQKLDGIIVVCLDAANSCRCENDDSWLFRGKELRDCRFIPEIQFRSIANQ